MKRGDLVAFGLPLRDVGVRIRTAQRHLNKFADSSVQPHTIFIVLGELSREQALMAAYTGQTQADVEYGSPYNATERWMWCMAPTGVYAIREKSLERFACAGEYRSDG